MTTHKITKPYTAKSRPILFKGEMVRAILDGRKTQTRRVIKSTQKTSWLLDGDWSDGFIKDPDNYLHRDCPYGKKGDFLWVRETFWESDGCYFYRADGHDDFERWKPSIHMPRMASRISLRIVDIRVERVQDIGMEDIKAEGVEFSYQPLQNVFESYRIEFESLWDSINAKRGYGWDENSWVWVVEFERVEE